MLQFVQSIWLLAAAGMIIPVVIHFWNVKRGKTVKVGSIAFLQEGSRQYGRSLRLRDLLLLLLRCLIILLTAIVLAGPSWRTAPPAGVKKGWILIEKQNRKQTYTIFRPQIDSLLKAGYELHDFNPGFTRTGNPAEALLKNEAAAGPLPSYWSLLRELERHVTPDVKVRLFTPNVLSRLAGRRPEIRLDLRWESYPVPGVTEWISGAHLLGPAQLRITRTLASRDGITHLTQVIPAAGTPEIGTTFRGGTPYVFLKKDTSGTFFPADTLSARITVYSDLPGNDLNYLQAALEAIGSYSQRNFRIHYRRTARQIPQNEDWLFWLSEKPVPAILKARNRFIYQTGRIDSRPTVIRTLNGSLNGAEPMPLFRKVTPPSGEILESIWLDGFGGPVLAARTRPGSTDYLFYSRFDPAWNQLVWSPEFPALLYGVLFAETAGLKTKDLRSAPQLLPEFSPASSRTTISPKTTHRSFEKPLWLLVFLLFCLERTISYFHGRRSHG